MSCSKLQETFHWNWNLMDKARCMFDFIPKLDENGDLIGAVPSKEEYNDIIKQYHLKLYNSFPWANCSSGQHDITDHIGEDIGSICEMSAQGIESQHHLWRYFLTNTSYKGDPQKRLDDSLENQYVLTDDEGAQTFTKSDQTLFQLPWNRAQHFYLYFTLWKLWIIQPQIKHLPVHSVQL